FSPFGSRTCIRDVARHEDTIQRRRFVNCQKLLQHPSERAVTARSAGSRLHPITVSLTDDVQIRQVCYTSGWRLLPEWQWLPVLTRPASRKLSPNPIEALHCSRETQYDGGIAKCRPR